MQIYQKGNTKRKVSLWVRVLCVLLCVLMLVPTNTVPAQAATSSSTAALYPYYNSSTGKYGYINKSGKVVVKAKYDEAYDFSDGYAIVGKKDSYGDMAYGFINAKGKVVVKLKYSEVRNFSEGYAAVKNGTKGWGFVDTKGKVIVEPSYKEVGDFSDGLVWGGGTWSYDYLDTTGQKVLSVDYDYMISDHLHLSWRDFSSGLVLMSDGYMSFFSVVVRERLRFVNKDGEVVINPNENGYEIYGGFHDGLALVKKDGKYGYINTKGKLVIDAVYDYAEDFSEGRAIVGNSGYGASGDHVQYGVIDKNGKTIVKLKYDAIGNFSEGMAWVEKDGKYGYVNKNGKVVVKVKYDSASDFSDSMGKVGKNGKYGYVNKKGTVVIKLSTKYVNTSDFSNGLARLDTSAKSYSYINKKRKSCL